MSFSDFSLDPALLRGISDLGFTDPTPIQKAALPEALAGRDVLAAAMTGSGKTAAFALPILQRLKSSGGGTRALVLTPTRELAAQVREHLVALGRHTTVRSVAVFGGVSQGPQERALRAGVDVVVATPGRLLDHLGQGSARFDRLEILVLDEADRMLDMGFLPDVRRILSKLPARRQTMLFSATLPQPIVQLSRDMLNNPVRIDVERRVAPATGVTHAVLPVPEKLKASLLVELLRRDEVATALVFTRTKHRANRLALHLDKAGIACDRIHGNRSQAQREAALAAFKRGKLRVLVATDLASRGIDIVDLPHVINFDVPAQVNDYIHRVGRTARAEATGGALTLASPADAPAIAAIERVVGRRIPRRTLEGFDYAEKPSENLEIPAAQRIAAARVQRAVARARTHANTERRAGTGRPWSFERPASGARPSAGPNHGGRSYRAPSGGSRRNGR
ncbi:MAG: DEAD/DEAH box helicase [Thermoanaerobaculales bacterium]